jgi:hypothetical protein
MFDPLQGKLGRILGGTALTVVLFIASPNGANAAAGRSSGAWRWLAGLWTDGIAAVAHDGTATRPAASPSRAVQAKDVVCPPTGCPTGTGTTTQGTGTDPDGKPH